MAQIFSNQLLNKKNFYFILLFLLTLGSIWFAFLFSPERTNDGLIHLFWNSFWSEQVKSGDLFPKWHAQGYGGYGNPSFLFYPPLLRYVSLPYYLLRFSPIVALKLSVATILILNIISSSNLATYIFKKRNLLYYQLILILAINPYLFYCLFWRGALAECLAIALMPLFVVAVLKIFNQITFTNGLQLSVTTFLIAVAHIPSLIILFFLFSSYSIIILVKDRNLGNFGSRMLFFFVGIGLSAPYLGPVFIHINQIGQPIWFSIQDKFVLTSKLYKDRHVFVTSLIFGIYFLMYIPTIRVVFKRSQLAHKLHIIPLIILSGLALFMVQPLSFPLYKIIFPLQKIQFPFRFIAAASILISALALLCVSVDFQKSKNRFLIILPIIFSLCIPHYFLLSEVLTPFYQDSLPKQQLSSLISERIKNPAYKPKLSATEAFISVESVKIGGKGFNLASGLLIVSDVVDYLPSTLTSKTPFWKFQNNTVSPSKDYQDHDLHSGNGQLTLVEASPYRRVWDCEIVSDSWVDLGISYFKNWKFQTNPQGMISNQEVSEDSLFRFQLKPGRYQLIGQYTDYLSRIFWLFPLASLALILYYKRLLKK